MPLQSDSILRNFRGLPITNRPSAGQVLVANADGTATWAASSGTGSAAQVVLLDNNLVNPRQSNLQALYDGSSGFLATAPDTVPNAITTETDSLTGYVLYLGENTWFYRQNGGGWSSFTGNKADFDSTATSIYTYK